MIGTSHAGLKIDELSGNLLRCQSAGGRHPTCWLGILIDRALLPPRLEVLDLVGGLRVLHPLDDLSHGDEVNIVVIRQDFVDPVEEGIKEFGIVLQPGGVEVEAERSAIRVVVTLKVVVQKGVKLIT